MNTFPFGVRDIYFTKNQAALIKASGHFEKILKLDTQQLEAQIQNIKYTGVGRTKNQKVEDAKLPPFILIFYGYFYHKALIPSEDVLFDLYLKRHFKKINNKEAQLNTEGYKTEVFQIEGLKARALRSYPSLIRDLHFMALCMESGYFEEVKYSLHQDFFQGNDLIIQSNGNTFHVSLHLKSRRGDYYKKKKEKRHDYSTVNEVIITFDRSSMSKQQDIYLFSKAHVELLKEKIEAKYSVK